MTGEKKEQSLVASNHDNQSFDVKNASGVSMSPQEIEIEIKKCIKTKKY
jgi:citrate lyase alpha subunit